MEKLWKAGFLYSLLICLFLPFKSTEHTWKYQLSSHYLRSSPYINFAISWKKYGIYVEKAHHFVSSGSMDSSSKSLHFHSFFRRVLIIPFGIFFCLKGSFLCWTSSCPDVEECPAMACTAVLYSWGMKMQLRCGSCKRMEKAWKKHEKLTIFFATLTSLVDRPLIRRVC